MHGSSRDLLRNRLRVSYVFSKIVSHYCNGKSLSTVNRVEMMALSAALRRLQWGRTY